MCALRATFGDMLKVNSLTKNPLTMIAELASSIYRAVPASQQPVLESMMISDPVLAGASESSRKCSPDASGMSDLIETIFADRDFGMISPREGELDPIMFYPSGGVRIAGRQIIYSLFLSAFRLMYFLGLPDQESVYIRTVLEGFEELRKAVRGEPVRAYEIKGLAQVTVPQGLHLSTPWGTVRSAPITGGHSAFPRIGQPITRALLVEPKLIPIIFDRAPSPDVKPQPPSDHDLNASFLFPLSCALASRDHMNPVVPVITWSTLQISFLGYMGYSSPLLAPIFGREQDASQMLEDLEGWSRIVDRAHTPEVDVAAKRLVSAVAHRMDKADALIDAVMVWENLLGTSNEVTFRVSASLAKLIESDPENRGKLKKELSDVYGIRSRIVHGAFVDAKHVQDACAQAIGISILALRKSYNRGREWLSMSSKDRSDEILLSWQ